MSKGTEILGLYNNSGQGPGDAIWTALGMAAALIESLDRVADALEALHDCKEVTHGEPPQTARHGV